MQGSQKESERELFGKEGAIKHKVTKLPYGNEEQSCLIATLSGMTLN